MLLVRTGILLLFLVAIPAAALVGYAPPHRSTAPVNEPTASGLRAERAASSPVSNAATDRDSSLNSLERRLRELGATHYVLERWGTSPRVMYTFRCEMPRGDGTNYKRVFSAQAGDPAAAMTRVVRQIETRMAPGSDEPGA